MNARSAPRPWVDAVGLALLKATVSSAVFLSGFRAVSDDDYARVVLAERFADAPSVDPTGTSWLPFPFYLYGLVLRLFGNSLDVASALAGVLGIVSVLVCWWAARSLDLSRSAALLAAALVAVLPYAAYLGVAPVPELPSAALCVFAAATLNRRGTLRIMGGAALFAACASRYEPWATALGFTLLTAWDAWKQRDRELFVAAALGIAFPLLWLLHGVVRHGDATFFVARVTAYRAALGPDEPLLARALRMPRALFFGEPELCTAFALFALPALWFTRSSERSRTLARFTLPLLAVALLVWLGDLRGSAPTHHAGRALLAVWLGLCLLLGELFDRLRAAQPRTRVGALTALLLIALIASRLRMLAPREPFANRGEAVDIGARARARGIERLAIDSDDYAFFAVQAAFGHPQRTLLLDDHDPRRPRKKPWIDDPSSLLRTLRDARFPALALPRSRVPFAHAVGSVSEENDGFVLVAVSDR